MKQARIVYKVLGLIPITFRRTIPEQWEDLTPEQLTGIGTLFLQKKTNDAQMVRLMYRLPWFVIRQLDSFFLYHLIGQLYFLQDFKPLHTFVIKKVQDFHPPRPRLENFPFGQFVFADTYCVNYMRLNQPELLHKFLASIYTPRTPFSEATIAQRAKIMAKLPPATQQAILINYRLIKEWLSEAYPLVFVKPMDDEEHSAPRPAPNHQSKIINHQSTDDWLKIFDNLVADDLVNAHNYATLPVHTVFRFITRKIKENAKRA